MSEELKPCPFCGGKNMRIWNTSTPWVSCDDCLANTAYGETKEEAIEQWNRRANKLEGQPTAYDPEKVVEQLEKAKEKDTEIALDEAQKERCFWYAQGMNRAIEIVKGGGADATD